MNLHRCKHWWAWLWLWTSFHAVAGHQHAAGPLHETAYWTDTSGQMTVGGMEKISRWQAYEGVLALGFTPYPVWVKLVVDDEAQGLPWVWRVLPSYLDDVRLYVPDAQGGWSEHRSGDRVPFHVRENGDVAMSFAWQAPESLPAHTTLYMRLQSTSTMVAHIQLLSPEAWASARDVQALVSGLVLGLMVLVAVWAAHQAYSTRDALFMYYAVYVACCCLMAFGLFGYAGQYWFPESDRGDFVSSLAVVLAALTGWAFHRKFLLPFLRHSRLRWLIDPALLISLGTLALLLAGRQQWALALTSYTVVVYGAFILPVVLSMLWWRLDKLDRRVVTFYLVFPVAIVLTMLPNLGWITAGALTGYGGIAHSLLVAVILAAMLALRQRNVEQSVSWFRAEAAAANAQADMIRQDRDEKDRFFAMLSHELRTPLSVIKMVLENQQSQHGRNETLAYAQRAVDDIDNVIALAMQVDRLEQGMIELQFAPCFLPEIVQAIRDSHEKGERVVLTLDPATPGVRSDPVLLKVILSNLLDNALKYSPPTSEVQVALRPAVHEGVSGVEVTVCNRLQPNDIPDPEQMFGKYYRSKLAHRVSGSGLGLYVVDGLVRLLKGSVRIALRTDVPEMALHVWIPA